MDGVLWRGDEPLPMMPELFTFLRHHHIPFALATNNSRKSQQDYINKLASMNVPDIQSNQIITSGTATAQYLKSQHPNGGKVYVVGGDGLVEVLETAGFTIADKDADFVVVGIDFNLTYDKLRRATILIRNGATFIGTNPDVTFPSPEGLVPGAGSLLALIEVATDVQPIVIGKPKPAMFEVALENLGTQAHETLMIGDRLGTDIRGGHQTGMKTALVLTGVESQESMDQSNLKPDVVLQGLPELIQTWKSFL